MKLIKVVAFFFVISLGTFWATSSSVLVPPGHHCSKQCGDLRLTDVNRLFPDFVIFSTDNDR